ncbi:MAG: hypothetical protein WKH64_15130 [Chloroflexia bacterium]
MSTAVIDVAQYMRVIIRWYRLIAILAIVGLLAGLVLVLARPASWQSQSVMLVKPVPTNLNVTSQTTNQRIDPVTLSALLPDLPVRTMVLLASQNSVEQSVQKQLCQRVENPYPQRLCQPGAMLDALLVREVPGRPGTMEVNAYDADPALSQELANTWASVATSFINGVLGSGYFDVTNAQGQKTAAESAWANSQAALTQFEQTSSLPSVAASYAAAQARLSDYLRLSNQIGLNIQNAASLRAQIQQSGANEATGLPVLLLGLSTFNSQAVE